MSDSIGAQPTPSKKRKAEDDGDIEVSQSPPKKQKVEPAPKLPVVKSVPATASSAPQQSTSGRELLLLVDYKGARKKMQLTATNVQDLAESVRKNLNTDTNIRIEYEDEDFSEFIAVDDLTTLPDKVILR